MHWRRRRASAINRSASQTAAGAEIESVYRRTVFTSASDKDNNNVDESRQTEQ